MREIRKETRGSAAVLFLLALLSVPAARTCAAVSPEEIYSALDRKKIAYNREELATKAAEAMVTSIDPEARILLKADQKEREPQASVVETNKWPEGIRQVKLAGFYDDPASVTGALAELYDKDAVGIIMDLRGAGGTNLAAIDKVSGVFLEKGTELFKIVDTHDNVVESHAAEKTGTNAFEIPLMILVNKKTHQASEFFAAAIQGRKGCLIMGRPTRGDAALREAISLSEDRHLYIRTRKVIPASGIKFDPGGVQPDIVVSDGAGSAQGNPPPESKKDSVSAKEKQDRSLMRLTKGDPVMSRAVDILLGLHALDKADQAAKKQ